MKPKDHGRRFDPGYGHLVRIPTVGGHSESVNIEFENDFDLAEVNRLLSNAPGGC